MRKYLTKARPKPVGQAPNCASQCLMSKYSRSPIAFSIIDCSTLLTVPLPVNSSFWQVSHTLVSPTSLGSSRQSFIQRLLWASIGTPPAQAWLFLALKIYCILHNPFLVSLILKPELHGQNCPFLLLSVTRPWLLCSNTFLPDFCFNGFLHSLFGCPEI